MGVLKQSYPDLDDLAACGLVRPWRGLEKWLGAQFGRKPISLVTVCLLSHRQYETQDIEWSGG